MNKVVHFEVPADDLARAKKFYGSVFGWQLKDEPEMDYVMAITVETGDKGPTVPGAINGGIPDRSGIVKVPSFAIDVDDIDAALEKIKDGGGEVVREKTSLGENMGSMAYFKDTEGNLLSLWQGGSG